MYIIVEIEDSSLTGLHTFEDTERYRANETFEQMMYNQHVLETSEWVSANGTIRFASDGQYSVALCYRDA
jgi:hypothetical protein